MKNLNLYTALILSLFIASCDKDDDSTSSTTTTTTTTTDFTLSSIAIENGVLLDAFRCESKDANGAEASLPLAWSNIPTGTGSLAIIMHHFPNSTDTINANSYMLLWGIDTSISTIAHGGADDGPFFMGPNKDANVIGYTSPCAPSGTGSHAYTITIYALDQVPSSLPSSSSIDVDYTVLKAAISTVTVLGKATIDFDDVAN